MQVPHHISGSDTAFSRFVGLALSTYFKFLHFKLKMSYNYPNQSPPPSSARGDEVTPIDAWKADLVTKDNDASTGNLNKRPSTGSDGENPHNKHRSGSNYKSADAFERLETTGQPTPNKYMPSSTNNHLSSSSQPPSRQLIEERIEEGTASVSPSSQHLGQSSSLATNSTIIRQPIVEPSTQAQEDIIERASRLESDLHLLSQLRNYIIAIGKDKNNSAGHPHQFPLLSNLDKCVWCHADELTHTGGRKLLFPHELLFTVSELPRLTPNKSEVDKNHFNGILSRWKYPVDKIKNQLRQQVHKQVRQQVHQQVRQQVDQQEDIRKKMEGMGIY